MNKNIIIDGCNVAECDSFLIEYEFPNNLKGGYYKEKNLCECGVQGAESYPFFCKDNPNCYFKQLQRAKAENEHILKIIDCKNGTIATLKTENEELKKKNSVINHFTKGLKMVMEENERLKKALEEIKNLLYTAENTTNGDLYFELVSKAYMKCNEVLNEG